MTIIKYFSDCGHLCDDCAINYYQCYLAGHGDFDYSPITEEIAKKLLRSEKVGDGMKKRLKKKFPKLT